MREHGKVEQQESKIDGRRAMWPREGARREHQGGPRLRWRVNLNSVVLAVVVALLLLCGSGSWAVPPASMGLALNTPFATAVAAGGAHSLVLGEDGVVYGAGSNDDGQITGGDLTRHRLTRLTGLPTGVSAIGVAAGWEYSLVVGDDGLVYGVGQNARGELTGTGGRATLTPLTGLSVGVNATAAAACGEDSLVVGDDGVVYGTGTNSWGQLTGTGDRGILTALDGLPVGVEAISVAAGCKFSLVVGDDGVVYGTGYNGDGQLTGTDQQERILTPLAGLPLGVDAVAVAAGGVHTLVVGDDGVVYGTGGNGGGQLTGTGGRRTLAPLSGLPAGVQATKVAAGYDFSVVVGHDGVVYGTGGNGGGQLTGTGGRRTLAPLSGLPAGVQATKVAAGNDFSLVVGDNGLVYGTGANEDGQLTGSGRRRTLTPVVWGIVNTVAPSIAGTAQVGKFLTAQVGQWWPLPVSYAYQWTRDGAAIAGGTASTHRVVARDVFTVLRVTVRARAPGYRPASATSPLVFVASLAPTVRAVLVAASEDHSLVVGQRRAYGSGANYSGELTGTGSRRALIVLTGLPAGVDAVAVSAGSMHSLVQGSDGRVYGSGWNRDSQLTGTKSHKRTLRRLRGLPAGVDATAIDAGGYYSLVLGDDGLVYGTGSNRDGQLTGEGRRRTLTPLTGMPAGVDAIAVAAGGAHSLIVGDDGLVYGAGQNYDGQLTGTRPRIRTLTPLTGLPVGVSAIAVAGGYQYSLVVGNDGLVYGAGSNYYGGLTGTDRTISSLTPLTGLPAGVRATLVAAGEGHSLAVGDDGVVYGTGSNGSGQLTGTGRRRTLTPLSGLPAGVRATAAAAAARHSLVVGDDGRVYGTGSNRHGEITAADPAARSSLAPMVWGIANTVRPRLTGHPQLGGILTAHHGQWWPAPTSYGYRWYRNGKAIRRATHQTYHLVARDLGTRVRLQVTAKHPGYQPATKTSTQVLVRRR